MGEFFLDRNKVMLKNSFTYSKDDVIKKVVSSPIGLDESDAKERLIRDGKNEIKEKPRRSGFLRFLDQFKDMMILVLIVAAIVSAVLVFIEPEPDYIELIDSGVILLIVFINAIIGFVQENKANKALDALKNLNKPFAKVMREGELKRIKSEEIVVGDIVILEAGDIVPADLRLIESKSLKIEEASLTGESLPTEKDADIILKNDTPLGDRKNMAFASGIVSYGRGVGIVVATGMDTEMGKIATMLNVEEKSETPLQGQLAKTAKYLSFLVLGIAFVVFVMQVIVGGLNAESIKSSFLTAVAIAVAAIPEGLPAVVTIVLALGVKRMSEKKAIVKNLPAVETLGCCQVICSDKTGTLTLNKMTVKELYTLDRGNFYKEDCEFVDKGLEHLIKGLVLCNDTVENKDNLVGDPTETALVAYAKKIGLTVREIKRTYKRIDEIPFDSKRKLMSTVHLDNENKISYTKGAVDMLLKRCTKIFSNDTIRDITEEDIENIKKANKEMGYNALRVLALAFKIQDFELDKLESELIFVGLVGMIDPPRPEVKNAVETCKKAGMKPVMITGDHLDTAKAIAKEIGIFEEGNLAITGAELDKMSDEEFLDKLPNIRVFARVSPENKVRIVKAFKSIKVIVAMTGDGVNDAPSIKSADIGIGMGITGTDVSKNVSDMILSDDNFATIITAVEEGRKVYSNIKKAVQYLLSANIAEVLCLFITTLMSLIMNKPLMFLSAIMILWINLVTDSLPALALGVEKAEKDIMLKAPRKTNSSLFSGVTGKEIIIQGLMQTFLTMFSYLMGAFVFTNGTEATILDHRQAMTMAFITLSLIQLFHSYNSRSQKQSLFSSNLFENKFLNISFVVGLVLVIIPCVVPFFQTFFETANLNIYEWLVAVGSAIAIIPFVEIEKLISRKRNKKN